MRMLPVSVKRGEYGAAPEYTGRGKRDIPEKTRPPAASCDTIPTRGNLGSTPPEIEPGSPRWEASSLTAKSPRPPTSSLNVWDSRADYQARKLAEAEREVTWLGQLSVACVIESLCRSMGMTKRAGKGKGGSMEPKGVSMEQRRNARVREAGEPRENPSTNDIVRHDLHMRKSGSDPAGNRTRFAWVGGLIQTVHNKASVSKLQNPEMVSFKSACDKFYDPFSRGVHTTAA
ncbi:hypothetical protein PR048_029408 [Dryococelus australis]|uniref:Uncharacterized protein n=1 Tax=Dryococelus australis TaxID=614101 RepID=A0ABQ9GFS8_9NEOP|nr:hypothetical protein PR048_029408 [Dryococelus australis]